MTNYYNINDHPDHLAAWYDGNIHTPEALVIVEKMEAAELWRRQIKGS